MNPTKADRPSTARRAHRATRRCECGTWFDFDALVHDDAVECPNCGRILARGDAEIGEAASAARTLQWIAAVAAVVFLAGGIAGMVAFLGTGDVPAAVIVFCAGLFVAALLVAGPMTIRALAEAVARLENRTP